MATVAGSVATISKPLGEVSKRPEVAGLKPVGSKSKKKGPYANSLNEGKVKQLSMDLKELTDEEFKKKYGKAKAEVRKELKPQPVKEADLHEEDVIMIPGQGVRLKPGFHKIDPDKAEHEGQTLKNSLHTIIRVATHLDKELSVRDNFPEWVSEKIGATKSMMVTVMDYLISAKEMKHDIDDMHETGGVIAGGGVGEGVAEGAKVDRMVKHIKQSEIKAGKSKDKAEDIAWATANKRGYLDNKNKKKGK